MDSKSTWLTAPPLRNSSCTHSRYANTHLLSLVGLSDILQALIIITLSLGILIANLLVIFVINSRRYSSYIHSQPRYLLTSLAINDLAIGLLITPTSILPSLFHCWPYGEIFCQIQALLRGALSQQSAVILVCMAIDRYTCTLHPDRYHKHSSKKGCVALISITWILSLCIFGVLVLPRGGYYFNSTGLLACDPFYSRASHRILSCCTFYFPTTMILMYCYGSAFHVSKMRLRSTNDRTTSPVENIPDNYAHIEKIIALERRLNTSASRTMAAMSLGFIVMVTPWTIQEVVAACTGCKVPPLLDFVVTWTALSNSFWNPFLYWLLNNNFRRISRELLLIELCCQPPPTSSKSRCCSVSSGSVTLPVVLPGPPLTPRPPRPDLEGLSEKYWGEILERTVSSSSLHALQKVYGPPICRPSGFNGTLSRSMGSHPMILVGDTRLFDSQSEPRLCSHDINCPKNIFNSIAANNPANNVPDL